jgi:uncharacterized protein
MNSAENVRLLLRYTEIFTGSDIIGMHSTFQPPAGDEIGSKINAGEMQIILGDLEKRQYKANRQLLAYSRITVVPFSCVVLFGDLSIMLYPHSYGENLRHPKSTDFSVVQKDDNTGFGVISYRSFKANEVLAHVSGEVVSDIRQHTLQIARNKHLYDPYFTGYLLHSCNPNVSLNMKRLTLTALRDIPENSFLYMDYAETEDTLFRQFSCSCGQENCRGVITGRKETPYINLVDSGARIRMARS